MRRTSRTIAAGAAALMSATALVVAAPAAQAATTLSLPGYGDVAVDNAHERVFISGGQSGNGIVVTDFSGRVRKTIPSQWGATGLELSADGSRLYAALAAGDAISVIDTATLTETARHATGAQTCPTHLARTGSLIWFGYGCEAEWNGKIGRLDPAAAEPVAGDLQGDARFQRAPLLAATGTDTGPLVAGQLALSLSHIQVYSVASGTLTAGANGDVVGASLTDLALTADGSTLFSASGSRDHVEGFAPGDLARRGAYAARPRPDAVAVSADGGHLAIGTVTSGNEDVLIYESGGVTPVDTIRLDESDIVAPRGVVWSSDKRRLFIVSQPANDPAPRLTVTRPGL